MRIMIIAAACLVGAAIPVTAQQQPAMKAPGAKDASRVKAGTYRIDSAHSQVAWRANHLGFNDYFGLFGNPTGSLTIDPANPGGTSVTIELPIAEIATSNAKLTSHLLSGDFFDATKFPTASFKSTSVKVDDDGDEAKVAGVLTIKGVSKPVTLDVDFVGAGNGPPQMGGKLNVGFHAEAKIRRSDFGISYGIPMVPDEIPIEISAAFVQQ